MKNILLFFAIVFMMSACNTSSNTTKEAPIPKPTPVADDPISDLEDDRIFFVHRETCRGYCPGYTYSIYKSGKVDYFGQRNVERLGNQIATMDGKLLKELEQMATDMSFSEMDDKYIIPNVADIPAITIQYMEKKIVFYEAKAPKTLMKLLITLDTNLDQLTWEKVD